jgi:hypothetical protein
MRRRLTPSMVISMAALFVALGGSAIAVGSKVRPVTNCGNGSIKAYASLNVDQFAGSFPPTFSSSANLFEKRWSCNGRPAEMRTAGNGVWEIRFPGVPIGEAVVSVNSTAHAGFATVSPVGDFYRVTTRNSDGAPLGLGFSIATF